MGWMWWLGNVAARRRGKSAPPCLESLEDRCVPSTVNQQFLIPTADAQPQNIVAGADRNVWFTEQNGNAIGHVSPSGQFVEIQIPTASSSPLGITPGRDGSLWFAETSGSTGNNIGHVSLDGTITEFTIPNPDPMHIPVYLPGPSNLVVGPDGNVYVTEFNVGKIGRYNPGKGTFAEFDLPSASRQPYGITVGPDGNIWFTEKAGNAIGRFNITTNAITEFNLPSDFAAPTPWSIVTGSDGNLWATLSGTSKIARITPTGSINEFTIPSLGSSPEGIVAGTDGALWFAEAAVNQIGRVTTSGSFSAITIPTGGGPPTNTFPTGITLGKDGNLWFTELSGNQIGEIVLDHYAVTGADAGGGPHVRVIDTTTGQPLREFFAYDANFTGGVRVALGDVNGDNIPDIIVAPGRGMPPEVKVFDGLTGKLIKDFLPYASAFQSGVFVAAGDVNRDGFADIITGADAGGGPHVEVFSGLDNAILYSYYAYSPLFPGGVRVAAADVNGDGFADIITGAGPGGGPHVEVWNGAPDGTTKPLLLQSYYAYASDFSGGVYVAGGDTNADGFADVITGSGGGIAANVRVFSGTDGGLLKSFLPYGTGFTGSVRVGSVDTQGDLASDIFTAPGAGTTPLVQVFDGVTLASLDSFFAYSTLWQSGVFVGAA